ncbi:MAG: cobyrinate a,c-diamide synthase [Anaerolineae bacterium]
MTWKAEIDMKAQILIAGTSSGVGKTTISMGLIAALRRRGWQVQPFKAGPDYIDPTYHTLAAGRPCRNIDTWMAPSDRALALYAKATQNCDIAVIEGVMGIFDGFSYDDEAGSSAQIAKLVQAPVLLVLDVGKMARSAGAMALGYTRFDPDLNLAGFIANRCGSENHYLGVKQAIEQTTGLPVVGWLPKQAELHIPERHLGLVPTDERGDLTHFIAQAADLVERYFDLDQIIALSQNFRSRSAKAALWQAKLCFATPDFESTDPTPSTPLAQSPLKIAVARDAAFSFYYEDNLDYLRENGVEILFFSPIQDHALPEGTAGLYLGGGFPEIYAAPLAANHSMLAAVRQAHAAGMPIYAECGGFMYLTQAIIDLEGQSHVMVGLIPGETRMQPRLMSLGYRLVESPNGNFLLPQGASARGHEFHWSSWEHPPWKVEGLTLDVQPSTHISHVGVNAAWCLRPRQGEGKLSGYAKDNLIGSYVHLHFASNPQLAYNFAQVCRVWAGNL